MFTNILTIHNFEIVKISRKAVSLKQLVQKERCVVHVITTEVLITRIFIATMITVYMLL